MEEVCPQLDRNLANVDGTTAEDAVTDRVFHAISPVPRRDRGPPSRAPIHPSGSLQARQPIRVQTTISAAATRTMSPRFTSLMRGRPCSMPRARS